MNCTFNFTGGFQPPGALGELNLIVNVMDKKKSGYVMRGKKSFGMLCFEKKEIFCI